ncbi:acyl carrier protein [Streptosporangium sp. NPDC051022]|uniref:acyl carrier protein n=1 Tax=Streptosporangium sp. NPDC051022 TaxID=3155752 RepID=UPI00343A5C96
MIEKVAEVLGVDRAEIGEQTDLGAEYAVDSLELMEIGARLERALGVRMQIEDLLEMKNIGHAVDLVAVRISA